MSAFPIILLIFLFGALMFASFFVIFFAILNYVYNNKPDQSERIGIAVVMAAVLIGASLFQKGISLPFGVKYVIAGITGIAFADLKILSKARQRAKAAKDPALRWKRGPLIAQLQLYFICVLVTEVIYASIAFLLKSVKTGFLSS